MEQISKVGMEVSQKRGIRNIHNQMGETRKIVRKEVFTTEISYQSIYTILSNDKINCMVCKKISMNMYVFSGCFLPYYTPCFFSANFQAV